MIKEQLYNYDDCVKDSSPEISLYEYGVVRNSYTDETFLYNKDTEEIHERIIGLEEVTFAIGNVDEDFFSHIEISRDCCNSLCDSNLSEVIMYLNEYSRFFF